MQVFNQDAELEGISSAPISVSRIKHTSLVEVAYHTKFHELIVVVVVQLDPTLPR